MILIVTKWRESALSLGGKRVWSRRNSDKGREGGGKNKRHWIRKVKYRVQAWNKEKRSLKGIFQISEAGVHLVFSKNKDLTFAKLPHSRFSMVAMLLPVFLRSSYIGVWEYGAVSLVPDQPERESVCVSRNMGQYLLYLINLRERERVCLGVWGSTSWTWSTWESVCLGVWCSTSWNWSTWGTDGLSGNMGLRARSRTWITCSLFRLQERVKGSQIHMIVTGIKV